MGLRVPALLLAVPTRQGPAPSKQLTIASSSASPSSHSHLGSSPQQSALASAHTATGHAQTLAAQPNRSRDGSGATRQNRFRSSVATESIRDRHGRTSGSAPWPCGRHWRCCRLVCRGGWATRNRSPPACRLSCVQQDREPGRAAGCLLLSFPAP